MTPEIKTAIIYPDRIRPANLRFILDVLPRNFFATEKYGGVWKRISDLHGPDHPLIQIGLIERYADVFERKTGKKLNMPALRLASIFHDTQRNNDNHDYGHGSRAVEGLRKFANELYSPKTINLASKICRHHEKPFKSIPPRIQKSPDVRFFMACDMLALVRDLDDPDLNVKLPEMIMELLPEFSRMEITSMINYSLSIHETLEQLAAKSKDRFTSAWKAGVFHGLFTKP